MKKRVVKRSEFKFDKHTLDCIEKIMKRGFNNKKDAVVYAIQSTAERMEMAEEKKK